MTVIVGGSDECKLESGIFGFYHSAFQNNLDLADINHMLVGNKSKAIVVLQSYRRIAVAKLGVRMKERLVQVYQNNHILHFV